jgi:hypothetical protein
MTEQGLKDQPTRRGTVADGREGGGRSGDSRVRAVTIVTIITEATFTGEATPYRPARTLAANQRGPCTNLSGLDLFGCSSPTNSRRVALPGSLLSRSTSFAGGVRGVPRPVVRAGRRPLGARQERGAATSKRAARPQVRPWMCIPGRPKAIMASGRHEVGFITVHQSERSRQGRLCMRETRVR